jgi:RHH-type transcriptional regulator, proline utilization regulon repressor / proline dehydrogenase / delta 1-pyrroline-5-carboxylate dehydrogenase
MEIEEAILKKGREILDATKGKADGIFSLNFWNRKILEWSMESRSFKVQLFRFVDVLPVLDKHTQIIEHLEEYFGDQSIPLPAPLKWALKGLKKVGLASQMVASFIKNNVLRMAKMFIAGATPACTLPVLKELRQNNLCFTVDLLGEASVSEEEALTQQKRYLELIEVLNQKTSEWTLQEQLDCDDRGPLPKTNVSVKLSSLYSQINTADFENTANKLKERLRPIFKRAMELGCFVNIDMEQFALKDLTYYVFKSLLQEPQFRGFKDVGIVVQAYLRSAEADLLDLLAWCQKHERQITIRLVKGAYWDYEVVHAQAQGWPVPVYIKKTHTDANYEKLTALLLHHHHFLRPAIASHNIRSLAYAFVSAQQKGLQNNVLEVQMLYGMGNSIKKAITSLGYRCRDYAPIGELIPGMAYFVRRLLENTSNESFLRLKYSTDMPTEQLLKAPQAEPISLVDNVPASSTHEPFRNLPATDFGLQKNQIAYKAALEQVKNQLGQKLPVLVSGKEIFNSKIIQSVNPCNPNQVVAQVSSASEQDAKMALDDAHKAWPQWAARPARERAQVLFKAAEIMRQKRFELAAWETYEVAKTWKEADADIIEAADFCEYYAREALKLAQGKALYKVAGEDNRYIYRAKGVGAIISPWNFPLAIPMGMVSAALVMGNSVLFKPASPSVKIGHLLCQILLEAGCPPKVLHFLPGSSREIGEVLTESPQVAFIAFTGSMEVGTHIIEGAAKRVTNLGQVKKVIAEMGGKNVLIIDQDADIDEAILGTLYSAFGFQGQKCSALSRLIVHEAIYSRFMERLREALVNLWVGEACDPRSYLSAVIDKNSQENLLQTIEETKKIAGCTTQKAPLDDLDPNGYYVPPTLFEDVPWNCKAATQELFGPVLTAFKVANIKEAVELANSLPFALTGGLFSRSPRSIAYIKEHLEAGNIYINRGITGAVVGRHPFGGYKLSGVGSKAGGPDYLLQFADPITVVENTMRKGFAPDFNSYANS